MRSCAGNYSSTSQICWLDDGKKQQFVSFCVIVRARPTRRNPCLGIGALAVIVHLGVQNLWRSLLSFGLKSVLLIPAAPTRHCSNVEVCGRLYRLQLTAMDSESYVIYIT
jgi:hypothetical protein